MPKVWKIKKNSDDQYDILFVVRKVDEIKIQIKVTVIHLVRATVNTVFDISTSISRQIDVLSASNVCYMMRTYACHVYACVYVCVCNA